MTSHFFTANHQPHPLDHRPALPAVGDRGPPAREPSNRCLHSNHAIFADPGIEHPIGIIGFQGQRQQLVSFGLKSLLGYLTGGSMQPGIGFVLQPLLTLFNQVIEISKVTSGPEVALDIVDGAFYHPFLVGRSRPAGMGRKV